MVKPAATISQQVPSVTGCLHQYAVSILTVKIDSVLSRILEER